MACVGETMKYGDQRQGAKLLQRVLDKFNYDLPPEIDTCALLRCTARLLMSVLAEERHTDPEMLSRLCSVFRTAANFSSRYNNNNDNNDNNENNVMPVFQLEECRWFERNSYNIALGTPRVVASQVRDRPDGVLRAGKVRRPSLGHAD